MAMKLKFHFIRFVAPSKMSGDKRPDYISWTEAKLAAVRPHLYTLGEANRLAGARVALADAGFAEDAKLLTTPKLTYAKNKLTKEKRAAIMMNHKQTAKKKSREKVREAEGAQVLRAQSKRLSLKCHT
jgi:hypothetical protein